ncbi:MAG TPA: hypothetical protein VIV12_31325 [Streptosporangiaceae bacterium]
MPFLAPALPFIGKAAAAVAPSVLGLLGGKRGGTLGGTAISRTDPTFRRMEQLGDVMRGYGTDYALPKGKELTEKSEAAFDPVLKYWSALLGGGPQMMEAIAPEVGTISAQYDTAKKAASQFAPQGGGRTALLGELPFRQQADVTRLIQQVRPKAAEGLRATAGDVGQLAGQVTSQGLQATGQAQSAIENQLRALLGQFQASAPYAQQTGAGLYGILKNLLGKIPGLGGGEFGGGPFRGAQIGGAEGLPD